MGLINLPTKTYSTTWASKPPASSMSGQMIRVSDIGYGNNLFISNGTRWQPLGGSCLVSQSNVAVSVTGTASETTLATISVPGGLMSANGTLEVSTLWSYTNAATSRNIRARFGAGAISFFSGTVTTSNTAQCKFYLRNTNSTSAQVCQPIGLIQTFAASTSTFATYTQDTSIDFNITLSATLTDTSQTVTLEGYTIFYTEG